MIAAIVLGVLALGSLFFAFGGPGMFSSGTSVTVSTSATPKPSPSVPLSPVTMPSQAQQDLEYQSTKVDYRGVITGPDPGRNIFAFYEPPPPCRQPGVDCPLPTPKPTATPTPVPTPHIIIAGVNPQTVYAGSRAFRMEISGERMLPDARVYMSQNELRTTFVNDRTLVAEVPANMISGEGPRQILVQTVDGTKHSNQVMLTVQAPPKPAFQYIGMIARKRSNNDTAYFMEAGKQTPMSARLSDVVSGRFRLISISADETIFEDVNLGFKHRVTLFRPAPGTTTSALPPPRAGQGGESYIPFSPNPNPNPGTGFQVQPGQSIPGIPDNIPRYVPPAANRPPPPEKKDDDDDGDGKP